MKSKVSLTAAVLRFMIPLPSYTQVMQPVMPATAAVSYPKESSTPERTNPPQTGPHRFNKKRSRSVKSLRPAELLLRSLQSNPSLAAMTQSDSAGLAGKRVFDNAGKKPALEEAPLSPASIQPRPSNLKIAAAALGAIKKAAAGSIPPIPSLISQTKNRFSLMWDMAETAGKVFKTAFSRPARQEAIRIYPAAALFNGRETRFNVQLVERLEKKGFKSFFPQRDGFEFGNLQKALEEKLSKDEAAAAVQSVIYFLDMGVFIPKSDVVIANLDEHLDPGVIVEIAHARMMGKPVIGVRTDVTTPFGDSEPLGGIHFFPAYQCDYFVRHYMPSKRPGEAEAEMKGLMDKILETVRTAGIKHSDTIPEYAQSNPQIAGILHGADLLFDGIADIHSEQGLKEIARRYVDNKEEMLKLAPKIVK